jgi:hypothetical protein
LPIEEKVWVVLAVLVLADRTRRDAYLAGSRRTSAAAVVLSA